MASLYNFVKRHRRKFVCGGLAVGGASIAITLLDRHINQVREEERGKQLDIIRKRNHQEATEVAFNRTFQKLFTQLKSRIVQIFETTKLIEALRQKPDKVEKIRLWTELKEICFTRTITYIIAQSFLGALLRIQLNILAGHLYADSKQTTNNNRVSKLNENFQKAFIDLSNYFVTDGLTEFSEIAKMNTKSCVAFIQLQDEIGVDNVENILHQIKDRIFSDFPERNLILNPGRFILSSSQSLPREMEEGERILFKQAVSETLEILESQEMLNLMNRTCQRGISMAIDQLVELLEPPTPTPADFQHANPEQLTSSLQSAVSQMSSSLTADSQMSSSVTVNGELSTSVSADGQISSSPQDFVSPCQIRVALVKLIPLISNLTDVEEQEDVTSSVDDAFLNFILESPDLKTVGANIYESFSQGSIQSSKNQLASSLLDQGLTWFNEVKSSLLG